MGRKGNCGRKPAEWINGVKVSERVKEVLKRSAEVHFFKGCSNHLSVHQPGRPTSWIWISMINILLLLDNMVFVRTHKSYLVNMRKVKKVSPLGDGYLLEFRGGLETAEVSVTYMDDFRLRLALYPDIERPESFAADFT